MLAAKGKLLPNFNFGKGDVSQDDIERLERSAAISDNMAAAYEDKMRAINNLEKKNKAEVEKLKRELDDLQRGGSREGTSKQNNTRRRISDG